MSCHRMATFSEYEFIFYPPRRGTAGCNKWLRAKFFSMSPLELKRLLRSNANARAQPTDPLGRSPTIAGLRRQFAGVAMLSACWMRTD